MELIRTAPIDDYVAGNEFIDVDDPDVRRVSSRLRGDSDSARDFARRAFEFVRDEIDHSWDIRSRRVTARASEVLEHREGICYAKSHLLAALCRAQGVPAGMCYQKITLFDDPKDGFCLHALNAVYLEDIDRWIRLDARGNKPGVDARFSVEVERLAFPVRAELGEVDHPYIYAAPPACIVDTLLGNSDCLLMYAGGLPTDLPN